MVIGAHFSLYEIFEELCIEVSSGTAAVATGGLGHHDRDLSHNGLFELAQVAIPRDGSAGLRRLQFVRRWGGLLGELI